jgi:DNA gyrase/topoisomerase IV subunit A
VVFLDATGRTYSLSAHTLPSARGYGEPLTGRFVLPPGATFTAVIMAPPHQQLLMASDAGYGFITRFEDLVTRNTKGKAILSLPKGARPLLPILLESTAVPSAGGRHQRGAHAGIPPRQTAGHQPRERATKLFRSHPNGPGNAWNC